MDTIYGESPEIQVEDLYANGGIALYSAGDGDETITGGSGNQGSSATSSRFYWSITRSGVAPNYTYSGGLTGSESFGFGFNESLSPFYGYSYADVWATASSVGTLDSYFQTWNATASELDKNNFINMVLNNCPEGCYRSYTS